MPSFNPSDVFKSRPNYELPEHLRADAAVLTSQIETAQLAGLPCFLHAGGVSLQIVAEQAVEVTIYQAFSQADFKAGSVALRHEPSAIVFSNCIFGPDSSIQIVDFEAEDRLLSKMRTVDGVEAFIEASSGERRLAKNTGQHDWMVYTRAIKLFPLDASWDEVKNFILPLFHVLEECHTNWAVEAYLKKRGLSEREIASLKCRDLDPQRVSLIENYDCQRKRADFIRETGINPDQIRTFAELMQVIDVGEGPDWRFVGYYLDQLQNPGEAILLEVVVPLLSSDNFHLKEGSYRYLLKIGREDLISDELRSKLDSSWGRFLKDYGHKPEQIKSAEELTKLVPARPRWSGLRGIISDYLFSLRDPSEEQLKTIIAPLLHSEIKGVAEQVYEYLHNHHRTDLVPEEMYLVLNPAYQAREEAWRKRREDSSKRKRVEGDDWLQELK